ncbi:MAG: helix-turn-helix domain-containing protein [Planctomycetota bacterium]
MGELEEQVERVLVQRALKAADDNKSKAVNLLGTSRKKLYKLLSDAASSDTSQPD